MSKFDAEMIVAGFFPEIPEPLTGIEYILNVVVPISAISAIALVVTVAIVRWFTCEPDI